MKSFASVIVSVVLSLLAGMSAAAQEGGNVADTWVMTVKSGQSQKFEEAFKKHLDVRIKRGDPRSWEVYQPVIGTSLSHYVIRACCFTWADFDSYDVWSAKEKVNDHWDKSAGRFVENIAHYIETIDIQSSNWRDDNAVAPIVSLTTYVLKPGRQTQWSLAMRAMSKHAKEGDWPYHWAWGESVGGAGERWLAVSHDNFAGMEPSDRTLAMFLSQQMGSKAEAMELLGEFSDAVAHTDRTIYRLRADMSSPTGK